MKILKAMAALFCFTLLGAAFSLPVVANNRGQPTQDQAAMDSSAQGTVTTNEAAQSDPSAQLPATWLHKREDHLRAGHLRIPATTGDR